MSSIRVVTHPPTTKFVCSRCQRVGAKAKIEVIIAKGERLLNVFLCEKCRGDFADEVRGLA